MTLHKLHAGDGYTYRIPVSVSLQMWATAIG